MGIHRTIGDDMISFEERLDKMNYNPFENVSNTSQKETENRLNTRNEDFINFKSHHSPRITRK